MALKVHHLRPAPGAKTAKIRVGRGEAGRRGKTAGRGTKGSGARKTVPENFEGGQMPLHMRLPKLRGFKNPFRVEYQVVNLDRLGELFPEGGTVGVADLVAAGAVRSGAPVKILGSGDVSVALQVSVHAFSASAKEKIAAAAAALRSFSALRREFATYVRRPSGASRRSPRSRYDPVSLPRRPCEASTRTTHISTAFPAQDTSGPHLKFFYGWLS